MFVLVKISDTIKIHPNLFGEDNKLTLIEEIDRKYANKVVPDVGLCISVYDFEQIGDGYIYPSDGTSHTEVVFRMIAFRPFVGQVIVGRITSCTAEHIKVSTEFSQDIIIPAHGLPQPSRFDSAERLWVWKYPGGDDDFFLDLNEPIRLRITQCNYIRVTKSAKGVQATTTEGKKPEKESTPTMRRRSSSVDLGDDDPTPSALQVLGTINEDGLGLLSWWS